jgi:hypothetical protein
MTKTGILNELAERTSLSRKQVDTVLGELESLIERHIKKRAVGEFTLPGLLKSPLGEAPGDQEAHGPQPGYRSGDRHPGQAGNDPRAGYAAEAAEGNGGLT